MTREEAIDIIKCIAWHTRPDEEDVEQAIKALEQEPCEDAISRQAVLDILKDKWNMFSDANDAMQESIDTIEALPNVKPQPKTGHWIKAKPWMLDNTSYKWECSECEKSERFRHNYCPNCGAKMVEP